MAESFFPEPLLRQAEEVIAQARARGVSIASAESCTAGLVAGCLSEIPGASDVLACGFVVYGNEAKERLLGVPAPLLEEHGAVSEETARAMASGALEKGGIDIAVSVTGIAGPGGGSIEKPVGLVHFACAVRNGDVSHRERRFDDAGRYGIRLASVAEALEMLRESLAR
ncbi:MAG: CinA family protein [Hyphomicrobiales bacterium]|nr:CinA family protein [Hyphomicrobiales bacterium]MCY4038855.1 CinA family protein [Hyphomicrobiales bacterium]